MSPVGQSEGTARCPDQPTARPAWPLSNSATPWPRTWARARIHPVVAGAMTGVGKGD